MSYKSVALLTLATAFNLPVNAADQAAPPQPALPQKHITLPASSVGPKQDYLLTVKPNGTVVQSGIDSTNNKPFTSTKSCRSFVQEGFATVVYGVLALSLIKETEKQNKRLPADLLDDADQLSITIKSVVDGTGFAIDECKKNPKALSAKEASGVSSDLEKLKREIPVFKAGLTV